MPEADRHVGAEVPLSQVGIRATDCGVGNAHADVFGPERLLGELDNLNAAARALVGVAQAPDAGDGYGLHSSLR